jgi:hypothetical protein
MADIVLSNSRFVLSTDIDGDILSARPGRSHLVVRFFIVWLVGWTLLGLIGAVATRADNDPDNAFSLLTWTHGILIGVLFLSFLLTQRETLRFEGTDLVLINQVFGVVSRKRRFLRTEIGQVSIAASQHPAWIEEILIPDPFAVARRFGSVTFSYCGRTKFLLPGIDQTQAAIVIVWLKNRLPDA